MQVFDLPLHSLYATLDGTSMQGLLDQASTLHQHWMEMTKVGCEVCERNVCKMCKRSV
jgi:hypothetical protein